MATPATREPNRREVPLGQYLRALARPLSPQSAERYLLRRDGAIIRKFKPPRRKKDRRAARRKG